MNTVPTVLASPIAQPPLQFLPTRAIFTNSSHEHALVTRIGSLFVATVLNAIYISRRIRPGGVRFTYNCSTGFGNVTLHRPNRQESARPVSEELTAVFDEIVNDKDQSLQQLMSLVYNELRHLAASYLRAERPDHTLQPTALVHEVYLRLQKQRERNWRNDAAFFQASAQMMRRVLVDHARGHGRAKRGCQWRKVSLDGVALFCADQASELLAVDESLSHLAEVYPRPAQVVELRFYGGLTVEETAKVLSIAPKTVKRDWKLARAWLFGDLKDRYGINPSTTGNGNEPF
jgi:RNA polymerase sigma-70 factor, ECF subfamily